VKPITLVLPYYENAGMLALHQEGWRLLTEDIRERLHVIVVDDCSPNAPALPVYKDCGLASYRLYRIGVDIRWNWLACRNLGAKVAETDWILLTDIDHVAPEATLRRVMQDRHDHKAAYRLARRNAPDLSRYHPHPDSYFLTRDLFWRTGGYDERFSGLYGYGSDIRHRIVRLATGLHQLDSYLIRYGREVQWDASVPREIDGKPTRKTQHDADGLARTRAEIAKLPIKEQRPKVLTFPYERLI
jgi:hypothetical protein